MASLAAIVAAFVLAGCASTRTYQLRPGERTPAAVGILETRVDDNNNTRLEIRLQHLPPAKNLDQSLTSFVVWIRPADDGEFRNIGQIVVNKKREGELRTTTPYSRFDVLVTAERDGAPSAPSGYVILRGQAGAR